MTINVNGVSKSFGKTRVLDNVSFSVNNGEVVGYVGLNGAGKTTTIRIAVGVLPPDSGDVLIDGLSMIREKKKASRRVGWVPELPIFETEFSALDYLVYLAGYHGLSASEARKMGKELLEELGLGNAMYMKLSAYSQGMKKRFALAVSMINDPPNFILDEVLNGLDPQGIAFFRELTIRFKKENKAVLFSSHILSEVEGIADRVVFIHKGKVIGVYSMNEIRYRAKPVFQITLDEITPHILNVLSKYGEIHVMDNKIILRNIDGDINDLVSEILKLGARIQEIKREEKSLEEFFFNLIRITESGSQ